MEVGGVPIGIYMVLFIVFAETGLFAGFFLPGDSLLFLSGIYSRELVETFFMIPSDLSNVTILALLIATAATLPVTMERTVDNLGVDDEVASFVLPIGATINMDGTSLYQAVAAVFIAQSFGMDLSLATQLGIIVTATLASIGSAAVPGAGMVMLVIVLAQAGIPEAGLALIFAIDRPLDMCRTTVNVTGDAAVSMIVAKSVNKLA